MKPSKLTIIIWTIIALLGVISYIVPQDGWTLGNWSFRWPTLTDMLEGNTSSKQDSILTDEFLSSDTLVVTDSTSLSHDTIPTQHISSPVVAVPLPNVVVHDTDTRVHLLAFYQALEHAHQMPVRVVHYGDSQIEEDRISNVLREQWQKKYGGGGVGLIPLHQTIPTRTLRQWLSIDGVVQTTQQGPKRYIVYGPKSMRRDDGMYGVMGQVACMDSSWVAGSEKVTVNIMPMDKKAKTYNYFNQVRLLADSIQGKVILPNQTSIELSLQQIAQLPDSTTQCEILLQGRGNVYGLSLETPIGVMVDNIPMRGCSGNIFTRIDSAQLASYYQQTNTRLIILQYGGNMIPQTQNPSTLDAYVYSLKQHIRYLRSCAPNAAILFIGPSDMSTRIDGQMTTYPLVPYLDRILQRMAQQEKIAYWSMYHAMGGYDSMVEWNKKGLAGNDHIHFTRAGAKKIGKILFDWIDSYQYPRPAADSIFTDTINIDTTFVR
jgi:lysophospholipase L1-like esterase